MEIRGGSASAPKRRHRSTVVQIAALFCVLAPAAQANLEITFDFSAFGTAGAWGNLHNDAWDGSTSSATKQAAAEAVMVAAAQYWEETFTGSSQNITQDIAVIWDPKGGSTLASGGTGWWVDPPDYTFTGGALEWDNDGSSDFFVDLTPWEHAEYTESSFRTADLGGGARTAERVHYNAGAGTAARGNADMLSTAIHEIGHTLGILSSYPKWQNLDIDSDNDVDLVDGSEVSYSGGHLTETMAAPEVPFGFPWDGVGIGSNNYYPNALGPSSWSGTRSLLSDFDVLAMASMHGFDSYTFGATIPGPVPEPSAAALLLFSSLLLIRRRRH